MRDELGRYGSRQTTEVRSVESRTKGNHFVWLVECQGWLIQFPAGKWIRRAAVLPSIQDEGHRSSSADGLVSYTRAMKQKCFFFFVCVRRVNYRSEVTD